jgi:hypothetical protein
MFVSVVGVDCLALLYLFLIPTPTSDDINSSFPSYLMGHEHA